MTPESCQALGRYNRWMNESLYATSAKLSDEERTRDRGAFFRSIHATLNHLLVADRIWMGRLNGVVLEDGCIGPDGIRALDQELHADFDALRASRRKTDDAIHDFAMELTAERLAANVRFLRRGMVNEFPTWWAVAQMFNHQTHHRGQVTTLLSQAGRDPGVTDLIAMLRSE
jgi:uncharacterized damage-inducible protein DinB